MSQFMNFSSLPTEQEQSFVVFEQRMEEAQKKGFMVAIVAAVVVFVLAIGIYLGVQPDADNVSKDFNMSNLSTPGSGSAQP
jgi:hypothetical protein